MKNCKFSVKIDPAKMKKLDKKLTDGLFQTAEALHTDLVQSQTLPFDTGHLQNESTSAFLVDKNRARISTKTPYAPRLYFHPEYNFQKVGNKHAGGRWLDTYLFGTKKEWCFNAYTKILKGGFIK